MRPDAPTRRGLILGAGLAALLPALPSVAAGEWPSIHVVKDPSCGCCAAWAQYLRTEGFAVTVEHRSAAELDRIKRDSGLPEAMRSCHTARVAGYVIEGHVPVQDIRRLLDLRPRAIGLAVPGMPWGAPGMGPEAERDAYDVHLVGRDGGTEVFARYPAA